MIEVIYGLELIWMVILLLLAVAVVVAVVKTVTRLNVRAAQRRQSQPE